MADEGGGVELIAERAVLVPWDDAPFAGAFRVAVDVEVFAGVVGVCDDDACG